MNNKKQNSNIRQNIKNFLKKYFYGSEARCSYSRWIASISVSISIGIVTILISVMIQSYYTKTIQAIETIKSNNFFIPLISFNLKRDNDKEAAFLSEEGIEDSTFEGYGDKGFIIKWNKNKEEWLALQWKLHRKNYEEKRYRYFLYFEGSARKNGLLLL